MANTTTSNTRHLAQRQMQKIRASQTLLSIFILLLIVIILWILISVVSSYQSSQVPPETSKLATPLTPTIDTAIFDQLEQKRVYSDRELENFPIYVLLRDNRSQSETVVQLGRPLPTTPSTPSPTPSSVGTTSATPTPSPSATTTTPPQESDNTTPTDNTTE